MSETYLCELCYDQMTPHTTTAWSGRETAVCDDCLAPPARDPAWAGLVHCVVAGTWDEAQDWLRQSSVPPSTGVMYVCAPRHLRGLYRPQVSLHGTYRRLPQWPEIATALQNVQADIIAPHRGCSAMACPYYEGPSRAGEAPSLGLDATAAARLAASPCSWRYRNRMA